MARKIASRKQKQVIPTIIGAGITEQHYFKHLQSLMNWRMKVRPRYFGSEDINTIEKKVNAVINEEEGFAVCVFDADVAKWNETYKAKMGKFIDKYRKNKNVLICKSLPSIEFWFLIHFKDTNKSFPTSASVIEELHKFIPSFDKSDSFLSNKSWVKDLIGKMELACERAKKYESSEGSYSEVYRVIELLKSV